MPLPIWPAPTTPTVSMVILEPFRLSGGQYAVALRRRKRHTEFASGVRDCTRLWRTWGRTVGSFGRTGSGFGSSPLPLGGATPAVSEPDTRHPSPRNWPSKALSCHSVHGGVPLREAIRIPHTIHGGLGRGTQPDRTTVPTWNHCPIRQHRSGAGVGAGPIWRRRPFGGTRRRASGQETRKPRYFRMLMSGGQKNMVRRWEAVWPKWKNYPVVTLTWLLGSDLRRWNSARSTV